MMMISLAIYFYADIGAVHGMKCVDQCALNLFKNYMFRFNRKK